MPTNRMIRVEEAMEAAKEVAGLFKPGFFDEGMVQGVAEVIAKHMQFSTGAVCPACAGSGGGTDMGDPAEVACMCNGTGRIGDSEQAAFDEWITREAGPGAAKRWPTDNGPGYANDRVQDYRTGWVECLAWLRNRTTRG